MSDNPLNNLFDIDDDDKPTNPYDEWVDMPEFVQEKDEPFAKIIVRFANEDDLNEFSKLIGQKLTPKTKSIWHPQLDRYKNSAKRWIDES